MKLRIATATLMLLGICSVITMRVPVTEADAQTLTLFDGGGAPTPCPPPPIIVSGPISPTTHQNQSGACPNGGAMPKVQPKSVGIL